ncbi:MAG: hypothetical protein PHY73_04790 [Candidatus Omnitrophica bacterium]|nr:hypothetical protein [Candidatus Omnitrophota bacterium]
MKKCPRCQVAYKDDHEIKCLYCDGILIDADLLAFERNSGTSLSQPKQIRMKDPMTHQRKAYLIGVFLKGKTFLSSFAFSANEMKKGEKFKRFFVQPLDISYIIKLPWLLVNFIYSLSYRLLYHSYCPECGWKYILSDGKGVHAKDECEYNQEYNRLSEEIFSGNVFIDLDELIAQSNEKRKNGKRSAVYDARNRNVGWESFLDVLSILSSIMLYLFLFTLLVMPIFGRIFEF